MRIVEDPYYGGQNGFDVNFDQISRSCDAFLSKILNKETRSCSIYRLIKNLIYYVSTSLQRDKLFCHLSSGEELQTVGGDQSGGGNCKRREEKEKRREEKRREEKEVSERHGEIGG